jgi:hypothetical protein
MRAVVPSPVAGPAAVAGAAAVARVPAAVAATGLDAGGKSTDEEQAGEGQHDEPTSAEQHG